MRRVTALRTRAGRPSFRASTVKELRLEALEDRTLFSASPSTANETLISPIFEQAQVTVSGPAAEASADDFPEGAPALYRRGVLVDVFEPAADTDVDRGAALRNALAAAQFGDHVVLSAGTYDMGGDQHVEFPAGVTVTGAGKTATRLTSSVPIQIDPSATYTLNNQTTIEDLWLEGSLHNGWYQTLVGMAGLPTEDVTTYLRRVQITGDSDGIYVWTSNQFQYTLEAYDCDINTCYDSVALLGSSYNTQTVRLWNCHITTAQPSGIPYGVTNCVNVSSGKVQLYNCTLSAVGDTNSVRTNAIWARTVGAVEVQNSTLGVSAPSGPIYDFEIDDAAFVAVVGGTGSGPGGTYLSSSGTERYYQGAPSSVMARNLFYNNSVYDGFDPAANPLDDSAIAPDKTALIAGTATFANVSGYYRGINGMIVDIAGVHGSISADDFQFKTGNSNSPSSWFDAPQPLSITMFGGLGVSNSDRIEIVWPDGAIDGQWLQVTLLANSDTGLDAPDVFYFGSMPGDTGVVDSSAFMVSSADEIAVRTDPHGIGDPASIDNPNDVTRDGLVTSADEIFVRMNTTDLRTALRKITIDESLLDSLAVNFVRGSYPAELDPDATSVSAAPVGSVGSTATQLSVREWGSPGLAVLADNAPGVKPRRVASIEAIDAAGPDDALGHDRLAAPAE